MSDATTQTPELHPLVEFGQTLQERGVEYFEEPLRYSPGEKLNWNFDSALALCRGDIISKAGELVSHYALDTSVSYDAIASSTPSGMQLALAISRADGRGAAMTMANLDKTGEPENTSDFLKDGYGLHGPSVEGRNVLLVAGSGFAGMRFATLAEMVRDAGGKVEDAFALVDRSVGRAELNLGRIGINYHSLYEMDEDTGALWVSDTIPGDFDRIRPAESQRVLDALLDVGTFQVKINGDWQFAGGQRSNNKVDFEEAYRHPKVLKLILESLRRMAAPFQPDLILPVADGANQLGLLLAVHMGLDIAYLKKDVVGPGVKTFLYKSEEDQRLVEESTGLIVIEDISNRRTSVDGVLHVPGVLDKARAALSILDRGLDDEKIQLPISEKSIVTLPLSNLMTAEHPLYSRAKKLAE